MLERSLGILFFLKKPKSVKSKECYVYLRITVDGKAKELSTKRKWTPERWSTEAGRAMGGKQDAKSLNLYLDTLYEKVLTIKRGFIEDGKEISAESLKNALQGNDENHQTVLAVFRKHNDQMKALVGIDYAPGTLTRYETSLSHTKSFIHWKYKKDDFSIQKLDHEFISDYAFWLKTVRDCGHNTTVKYLANFKKIVLICVKNGWISRDPFINFKMSKKEVIRTFLSKNEIETIFKKNFVSERVSLVRDIFLFSCFTGLAYIDVKQLRKHEILIGVDGRQWIISARQKTGSPTKIPLHPLALKLVLKYKAHPKCLQKGTVFPVLSNQKMNSYLKEIADVCGIQKELTFHIARHTFATTVTLSNGVPIETVSKLLGHSSIKQTQHYAKIVDTKISQDMDKIMSSFLLD